MHPLEFYQCHIFANADRQNKPEKASFECALFYCHHPPFLFKKCLLWLKKKKKRSDRNSVLDRHFPLPLLTMVSQVYLQPSARDGHLPASERNATALYLNYFLGWRRWRKSKFSCHPDGALLKEEGLYQLQHRQCPPCTHNPPLPPQGSLEFWCCWCNTKALCIMQPPC